ncbi:MAG TPA: SIS domain-containing protein [Candidatus Nanoarchaeia archaeon]|nr:SIS domain-containing protein [Candidatus Nanoarchaeia archaeon]
MEKSEDIKSQILESIKAKQLLLETETQNIELVSNLIIQAYKNNKKVLIFGNGGSAADSQHFVAELVNKFKIHRKPLPALALTTDTSILTSIGNDSSFDEIFQKQIEAHCNKDDIVIAITTSDISKEKHAHSTNIYRGILAAKEKEAIVIGLLSIKGIEIGNLVDYSIKVPSIDTQRIQESHILILHIICDLVEKELFNNDKHY